MQVLQISKYKAFGTTAPGKHEAHTDNIEKDNNANPKTLSPSHKVKGH